MGEVYRHRLGYTLVKAVYPFEAAVFFVHQGGSGLRCQSKNLPHLTLTTKRFRSIEACVSFACQSVVGEEEVR